MYFVDKKDGYINGIGTGSVGEEISRERYEEILAAIKTKPECTATTDYRLLESLVWEEYERDPDPEPEPAADDILDIILGVSE